MIVAVLAWKLWSYGHYVTKQFPVNIGGIDFEGLAIINFIVLVAVLALAMILLGKKIWALSLNGLVVLLFLFEFGFTQLNLLGAVFALLLGLNSQISGLTEIRERTKINTRKIFRSATPSIIVGLFILVSFAAYQSPGIQNLKNADRLPSETEKFIKTIVDKFADNQIEALNQEEKQMIADQVSDEATSRINGFLEPYFKYSPPILAFGLFLILLGLSWFFIWLSVGLGMFIFFILKKTGFVKIEEKDVKAEVLII